ncbi:IS66 family insertion sequence element accessory protein TnpB [Pseudomonas sp. S2_A02]|jgi:transposase
MMRPNASVEKVYLYSKPVDFRKSIDGLAALVELDIKVAVFDPVLFVFLNRHRNRVKVLYWESRKKRSSRTALKPSADAVGRVNQLQSFRGRVSLHSDFG